MGKHANWNGVRFDVLSNRGHAESYFLKANSPDGERALWLKATILAAQGRPAHAIAEIWAVLFSRDGHHVVVKQSMPYGQASFSPSQLEVTAGTQFDLNDTATRGDITFADRRLGWELRLSGESAPIVMLPMARMYTEPFPKTKLVSPKPDLRFDGFILLDGKRIDVRGWRGMQGHNWGTGHADTYAWGHCNQWDGDEHTVVEAVSARVRVGSLKTPLLTLVHVRHDGRHYAMTGLIDLARNRGEIHPRRWFFGARAHGVTVEGDFSAQTSDMVGLHYANPNGSMSYCLNSKLANARLHLQLSGREPVDLLSRSAAFELGTTDPEHGVKMYV